jgi:hypothetical protein
MTMQKTFGPAAVEAEDGSVSFRCRTSGTYCFLLNGNDCRDQKPARLVPDLPLAPDWCQYKASMQRDYQDMADMRQLGLMALERPELIACVKLVPAALRGLHPVHNRPRRLSEMDVPRLRMTLLQAHRKGFAIGGGALPVKPGPNDG